MGTKNNPAPFDCYVNAEPDEPMFVLLARDETAPQLVRLWAEWRRQRDGVTTEQIVEAEDCADDMEIWRARNR